MAPISPDNTQRFFVDYTVCGYQHTMLMRAGSTVAASDASATLAALFDVYSDSVFAMSIDGFRSALPGTNITVPETWLGDTSYGSGAGAASDTANYMDAIGRGSTGHRVRVGIFGSKIVTSGGDYRIAAGENALVGLVVAVLTSDADMFLDVDYEIPVWKSYLNCGVNAYWRNKVR